jgi:hypothetical protein
MNKSLPPIEVYVRNSFLVKEETEGVTVGYLIGVRSLQNQALQFQVLLSTGALFTGLPAHSICFEKNAPERTLQECQHWDNISSEIDIVVYETLLYMPCTVKVEPNGEIIKGEYLFTLDYVGSNDLSRNPTHWKMFHAIKSDEGNLHLYAQYRIKFMDTALCYEHKKDFPNYTFNENIWKVGS